MKLLAHGKDAGLFSQINFLVTHIEALGHAGFFVDWTKNTPYSDKEGENLFEFLFRQNQPAQPGETELAQWPHHRYTGAEAAHLYLTDRRWRRRLHECWKLLRVRQDVLAEAEAYCGEWTETPLAVHVRNLNIGTECPGGQAPGLQDYENAIRFHDGPVFLATDNQEALDHFRSLLGERLAARNIARSPDMGTEYHLSFPQTPLDARHCLVDALIMARCRHLVHSVSNIATAVLYMNPDIGHTFVQAGGAIRLPASPPDERRSLVAQTLRETEPEALMHLTHPKWKDWILLYPGGVFARHTTGYAGTLSHRASGEVELDWLDWGTEHFVPVPPPASPANFRNPTWARVLRPRRRVVVRLMGGMGNQMFQYAFGLAVAREWDANLQCFHAGWGRPFALGPFGISAAAPASVPEHELRWEGGYENGIEQEMFREIRAFERESILIDGYFQNENFFAPVAGETRNRFTLEGVLPGQAADRTPVAVHVRRGDYAEAGEHFLLPDSYYRNATEKIRSMVDDPFFLVFSDEPEKCPDFLRRSPDALIMPAAGEVAAMASMQACKAFIIANSTFGWWPAWLSGSPNVIRPDRFLSTSEWNICPRRWIALPANDP